MRTTHALPFAMLLPLFAACDDIHIGGDPWDEVAVGVQRRPLTEAPFPWEPNPGPATELPPVELPPAEIATAIFFDVPSDVLVNSLDVYECGGDCDERPPTEDECHGCPLTDTPLWSIYGEFPDNDFVYQDEEYVEPSTRGPIRYGVVPPDFASSWGAPSLKEDRTYIVSFWGQRDDEDTGYSLRACRFFRVSDGVPIELQGTEE